MNRHYIFLLIIFVFALNQKLASQTSITIDGVSEITYYNAKMQGTIINNGGGQITRHGFVFGTNQTPNKQNGGKYFNVGTSVPDANLPKTYFGTNTAALGGYFNQGETYYVRAWFARKIGTVTDTVYSDALPINVPFSTPPTVLLDSVYDITLSGVKLRVKIPDKGDINTISAKGVVYTDNLDIEPKIGNATVSNQNGNASVFPFNWTANLNGLVSGREYIARSYIIFNYFNKTAKDTIYSEEIQHFTIAHPCKLLPLNIYVDSIDITTAKIHLTPNLGQKKWEIEYGIAGHEAGTGSSLPLRDSTIKLTNLTGGRSYTVYIRSDCDSTYGDWSEGVNFTTIPALCAPVVNLNVVNYSSTDATVTWMPGSMLQTRWEVLFAKLADDFPQTGITVTETEFHPIGLTPRTDYKLKVRALCDVENSDWSAVYSFVTLPNSLEDDIKEAKEKVSIYPNPTKGIINFKTNNTQKIKKVEIFSALGEKVYYNDTLPISIDLTQQSKGLFLIKIYYNDDSCQIEKIILN
ncbi:MAG: T9SS type A sorting domain-containing protein [Bacteroidales bacterium]|jgi:hypothetical protein|nr:T9SS type A sorting domain-containing protein [Bacteroidales bacterium]